MNLRGAQRRNGLFHKFLRWSSVATVIALVCACSGPDDTADGPLGSDAADPSPQVISVPDPAMESPAEPEIGRAVRIDTLPTELTLNDTQDEVFVPGMGWVPLDKLWDLYENDPARLPDNFDFQALRSIRESLAEQDHDDS